MNNDGLEKDLEQVLEEKRDACERLSNQIRDIIIEGNYDPSVVLKTVSVITSFFIIECKDLDLALKVFAQTFDEVARSKGKFYELSIQPSK